MHDLVSVKGSKEGLRVQLDETTEWSSVLTALHEHLDQGGSFFAGARLLVDIGERILSEPQMAELLNVMEQHGLRPEALITNSRESRNAARSAGVHARVAPPSGSPNTQANAAPDSEATLIVRTVRSGQVVRHQGHITLIGDVNPGAEVIAGGSVVVWGRLRGMVHAGAMGNDRALICALELRPTQLRIANLIARTPEETNGPPPVPEVARIDNEHIVVEAWELYRR
jgi:septum site-determining protein MinC